MLYLLVTRKLKSGPEIKLTNFLYIDVNDCLEIFKCSDTAIDRLIKFDIYKYAHFNYHNII
jgi:hypothetical protein